MDPLCLLKLFTSYPSPYIINLFRLNIHQFLFQDFFDDCCICCIFKFSHTSAEKCLFCFYFTALVIGNCLCIFSKYSIHVDKNLKGELAEDIVCAKMGGLKSDGTMLLAAAETPAGELILDSGLPEIGKQYVFLAYAQPDGSLTLSEIFDNREYDARLLEEYADYVENEIPYDRERFVSAYDMNY